MKVFALREIIDRFVTKDAGNSDFDVIFVDSEGKEHSINNAILLEGKLILDSKEKGE
jgi:hypothetical protein